MPEKRIIFAAVSAVVGIVCAAVMMAGCQTPVDHPAAATIDFKLQEPGRVSLAVYDTGGRQVRTLLNAALREKGRHAVSWDGLDRDGTPLPAGEYTWKLLESQGLQAEYLMALGTSTGLNHWPGQHNGPVSIACDGESIVVGGAPEGSPLLAKVGLDGKFHWNLGQFAAPEAAVDAAMDGDRLYSLQSSTALHVLQKSTGEHVLGTNKQAISYGLTLPVRKLEPIAPTTQEVVKIEIPVGEAVPYLIRNRYLVRMTVGQNEKSDTVIGCKINGQWFGFYGLKPGEKRQMLAPTVYNNVNPVDPINGKIVMEFGFKPSQPGAQWYASELELVAPVERIDARAGALVGTFPAADTLAWVEPDTGKLLEQVKVPNLRDVALLDARTALVISGDSIVKVSRDGVSTTVITGLTEPTRLAWDAASKTLWVVEGGTSQQIKRFGPTKDTPHPDPLPQGERESKSGLSASPGERGSASGLLSPSRERIEVRGQPFQLSATYGRLGGRKQGLYKPEDFLSVSGIDGDGHGGFVICESDSAPRRSAHFDRDGKLLREWYGGQQFYTFAAADPEDPTLVWMDSQWGYMMQVKVDYAKKDWTVRACYQWGAEVDPQFFTHYKMARRMLPMHLDLGSKGQKETYLWSDSHFGLLLKVDEQAGLLHPVAGLGLLDVGPHPFKPFDQLPPVWQDAARRSSDKIPTNQANRLLRGFGWADANGDYKMQSGELRLIPSGGHGFSGSSSVCLFLDDALTIYQGRGYGGENQPAWVRFPAQGRTPTGAPIWDWSNSVAGATSPFANTLSLLRAPDGDMFTVSQGGGDGYAGQDTYAPGHGWQWPANLVDATAICKWDKDGRLLWRVGPHASRQQQKPGELHHPVYLAGRVNGAIGVCDKIINPCEFWSEDGLYIGGLLDRRADDGLPRRAYAWWKDVDWKGDAFDNLAAFQYDMIVGGSLAQLPGGDAAESSGGGTPSSRSSLSQAPASSHRDEGVPAPEATGTKASRLQKSKCGEVVYFGAGWNNVPVYRVKGWDQIRRQQGTVWLAGDAPHARLKGQGLAGEYYGTNNVTGTPAFRQTASRLWFEPARKGFAWPTSEGKPAVAAARWTGTLEPKFSEDYTLSVYAKGNVRLWLGGKLLVEVTNKAAEFHKAFAEPVRLSAGQRYAIKAEWVGPADGQFHLNWESLSQPIEHIPTTALYAEPPPALPVVTVRPSIPAVARTGGNAEWIVARQAAAPAPLTVTLGWQGTAVAARDYRVLPTSVTIPAGKTEVRLPVRLLTVKELAPTRELAVTPAVSAHYLLDGSTGVATLRISDPRAQSLPVAGVTVSGEGMKGYPESWLNLRKTILTNLTNQSGLDRSVTPPVHDTDIKNAWYADWSDPDKTALTFDLGAVCDLADVRVWNLNTRSAHGTGWGQGPTVRAAAPQIRMSIRDAAAGPWTDLGEFKLHEPSGDRPDAGDLLPIGRRARYVQIRFAKPHGGGGNLGLAEVEFYGSPLINPANK